MLLLAVLVASGVLCLTHSASAQKRYVYFPTYDIADAHFLSVAGTGIATLAGQNINLAFASPSTASSIEIGIFDGETGGMWDVGTTPLEYTLFADPNADGTGTVQVARWVGDSMLDNKWFNATVANTAAAKSAGGAYFYTLRVRSTNPAQSSWSNFKVRTDGTVTLRAGQAFAVTAPLTDLNSARVVYPLYPSVEPTSYDGTWTFFLNVPSPLTKFEVWDGDMDFGAFDCSTMDSDDPDTPSDSLPSWAAGTSAVPEGVARGSMACIDGDTATSEPPDDAANIYYRRSPSIVYEVIDPNGNFYTNNNPSGNLEWEQFMISTAPEDRTKMDYHADSLPAGIYQVRVTGMDMQNLNAWRFGSSINVLAMTPLGVDSTGTPVVPPSPTPADTASIAGTIFYDGNSNGTQDAGVDLGVDGVIVNLSADFNNDGTADKSYTTTTDDDGRYDFGGLKNGKYTITIDQNSLGNDLTPTSDPDGVGTPNKAVITIDAAHQHPIANFGYHQNITGTINGPDTVINCSTTTFTVTTNQTTPTYKWTITGAGTISGSTTGSSVTVNASCCAGTYTLSVTITKNGSSRTVKKTVVVIVPGTDFVLFAYTNLYFKGRYSDADRGFIDGNVGVNNKARSTCSGSSPNLTLGGGCTPHAVYVSNGSKVMGDYVDLGGSKVSVYDLYYNRATGSTSTAIKRHSTVTSLSLPIISSTNLPVIPSFTYGCNNVTVNYNATTTLAPGKYGTITVRDGGTLNLGAGIYNIKSLIAGKHTKINTNTATKVRIASKLSIDDDSYVGPANYALFIVRSDGLCSNDASVAFNERTEFHGQVFAPNGVINLGRATDLFGRFWSYSITSDYDVNVTYASPVTILTRGNNDGFQKKQLENGAVTGEMPTLSLMQNYPNPFKSTTTIGFNLSMTAPVTVKIIDGTGRQVKTLLDAVTMQQGENSVAWDGRGENGEILPSGTYFYRVECDGMVDTKPLVLTRD